MGGSGLLRLVDDLLVITGLTVEMHGNINQLVCPSCGVVVMMTPALLRKLRSKKAVPCAKCDCQAIRCRIMLYDDAEGNCTMPFHCAVACCPSGLGLQPNHQMQSDASCVMHDADWAFGVLQYLVSHVASNLGSCYRGSRHVTRNDVGFSFCFLFFLFYLVRKAERGGCPVHFALMAHMSVSSVCHLSYASQPNNKDYADDVMTPEDVFDIMEEDVQQADLILWVGISFEQSASTAYFRRVSTVLSLSACHQ